ncbi:MAG: CoA transferase, partial [Dehalococcoidia bacterium]
MSLWIRPGLRVVELGGGISVAYAARLLADFGADVIKIEPPDAGDPVRHAGPFLNDTPNPEASGLFLYLNFNKRSVALDVTTITGAATLAGLLAEADILIENLGAGRFDALPIPPGAIPERLVICSIAPYGQDGPKSGYAASEISAYAAGGMMYITGDGAREPVKHGLNQAAHLAGVNAAASALAAALLARHTGVGQRIDISAQETVAQTIFPALNIYSHTGGVMRRAPSGISNLVNSSPMATRDGYIMPSYAGFGEWEAFSAFIGVPELAEEQYLTSAGRLRHAETIDRLVAPRFRAMPKDELFHSGQEWRFTFTSVQTAADLDACPQLNERGYFVEQHHPVAGAVRMPGMVPFAGAVPPTPHTPAPMRGEHTDEVQKVHGGQWESAIGNRDAAGIGGTSASPLPIADCPLPLEGIRILELGMVFVLPYALTPLAALGADVIKVEAAARPDQVRWGPPPDNSPREDGYNHGAHFQFLNRNKRGITIDLTNPQGQIGRAH